MNKLYIVRHGKTDWNVKGWVQGSTDIELNEEGIRQAKELSEKIDLDKIDICLCSSLKRAKQTAEILVKDKVKIIYDNLLVERGFGNYEGKPINFNLIVSHGGFIKALHFNLIGYDKNTDFLSFNPQNATVYEYYNN